MRASGARLQMINGCHDLVAGLGYVQSLARRLRCPLILTGAPRFFLSGAPYHSRPACTALEGWAKVRPRRPLSPSAGEPRSSGVAVHHIFTHNPQCSVHQCLARVLLHYPPIM